MTSEYEFRTDAERFGDLLDKAASGLVLKM